MDHPENIFSIRNDRETKEFFTALLNTFLNGINLKKVFTGHNSFLPDTGVEFQKYPVLDIPLEGEKHISFGSRQKLCEYRLLPGEVLCTPAGVWKKPFWDGEHKLLCLVFTENYLRLTFIDYMGTACTGRSPLCRKYCHTFQPPSEIIRHTLKAFLSSGEASEKIRLDLLRLLLEICRDFLNNDSVFQKEGKGDHTFKLVRQYLLENFSRPLTRRETAACFHLNASYLSRLFQEHGAVSFSSELRRIRMEHAAFLLKNTDLLVDEIALQCGCASTPSFTAAFKKLYGMPPGIYRRS